MSQVRRSTARIRRLGIPIGVGFFLLLYAAFGAQYFDHKNTQDSLKREIATKTTQLARPMGITDQLQAEYDAADSTIPVGLTGFEVTLMLLDLAGRHGFNVDPDTTPLVITEGATETRTLEGINYSVLKFTLGGVAGDYEEVKALISSLHSEPGLETLVLDSVNFDFGGNRASAVITFHIYTRP